MFLINKKLAKYATSCRGDHSRNNTINVQHIFVQAHKARITENQIEVLQRLRKPETLHWIRLLWSLERDVFEYCIRDVCTCDLLMAENMSHAESR